MTDIESLTVSTARLMGYSIHQRFREIEVLCPKGQRVLGTLDYPIKRDHLLAHYLVRHHLHDHYGIDIGDWWK